MSKKFTGKWAASPANINTDAPFDVRLVVSNLSDLLSASTYNKGLELYPGIVVAVIESGKESLWTLPNEEVLTEMRQTFADASYKEPAEATEENVAAFGWKKIGDDLKEQVSENTAKLTPVNYDPKNKVWKNYVINYEGLESQSGLTIAPNQIYTNTETFSVNTILGNNTNTIFSVSNDGVISGSSVLWADESATAADTHIVTKGYLDKKLEEFTPKIQSQLQMFVYDVDENGNIESAPSDDIANIQIVRETSGALTFEVEDTVSSEHLAGSSQSKVLNYLQFTINDEDSNGILHPSDDIATIKVVRYGNAANRELTIRIS